MPDISASLNGFVYGLQLHLFFNLLVLIGGVLFIVWMFRFAKKEELRNWIIGLLAVGLLGCIITFVIFSRISNKRSFIPIDPGFEMMMDESLQPL